MSNIIKKIHFVLSKRVISLTPKNQAIGRVLLSYTTLPFLDRNSITGHSNRWECTEIALIFLNHNYKVDIIDYNNKKFIPKKKYDFCIDVQDNLERLTPFLGDKCKKIFHITTAHWLFQNTAEYQRISDIKNRRNFVLTPKRTLSPSYNIELSNCATILGNNFTKDTYKYADKEITEIPISTTHTFPSPQNKNFESIKNNFIWIGGAGMAHKGLDLVLEAFHEMPEYSLSIFGKKDDDFANCFKKELFETTNIKYYGHIDLGSKKFGEIASASIALVFPSCSEGCSGGVITAMHAGLIPIISYESGVDVDNFGVILSSNNKEEVKKQVRLLATSSTESLKSRAIQTWESVNQKHTRESFSKAYNQFVKKIIKDF